MSETVMTESGITPPPELVLQISLQAMESFPDDECGAVEIDEARDEYIANFFAQWGADQELEACCEWLESEPDPGHVDLLRSCATALRTVRRPKPLSLTLEELIKQVEELDRRAEKEIGRAHV